ncbi:MAG: hypothetical protein LBI61_03830 [Puniceicoccales bacterium]|nr:hypothetical protein [Puniceicoccales bacterium]
MKNHDLQEKLEYAKFAADLIIRGSAHSGLNRHRIKYEVPLRIVPTRTLKIDR